MNNDYQIKKPKDLNKINSNDVGELIWWSFHFGVTIEKLITLVHKYGTDVKELSTHLKEQH